MRPSGPLAALRVIMTVHPTHGRTAHVTTTDLDPTRRRGRPRCGLHWRADSEPPRRVGGTPRPGGNAAHFVRRGPHCPPGKTRDHGPDAGVRAVAVLHLGRPACAHEQG